MQQNSFSEMTLQGMSVLLYVELCLQIGTSQQVTMRRDIMDITESIMHSLGRARKHKRLLRYGGSVRDGFTFMASDMDFMEWTFSNSVFWDFRQALLYSTPKNKPLLCDSSKSPPGFTLLWFPWEKEAQKERYICSRIDGALCISSEKYKHMACCFGKPNCFVHGPCSSGRAETVDFDYAYSFASNFWPPLASSWIDRCHTWPLPCVVHDIIRSGCHFVAIGHKHSNHFHDEWRISFALAEQKLVYSMNHTQFLTYGLLKLFVKDFNNGLREKEKLLCSYHMKTAIFWTIQQNTIDWCPQNLLDAFWICFKLLLKWVHEGVCPNFFIPENNIFLSKVYGHAQRNLFTRLYGLYEKGISFLLESPSISFYFKDANRNSKLFDFTNNRLLISDDKIASDLLFQIRRHDFIPLKNLNECLECLHTVEQLIRLPLSQYHIIMLQKHTATILQSSVQMLHATCTSTSETTKIKFERARKMPGRHVDTERNTGVVGRQPWYRKIRHILPVYINIPQICSNELTLEQQSSSQKNIDVLSIPPFILLHMLEFLCCRHVDPVKAQTALNDLQDLVHRDQGLLVPKWSRNISWEILGICQEIAGNYQAAFNSYLQSFSPHFSFCIIQIATIYRILILLNKLITTKCKHL
uniref:Uncharacterized protein LOC111122182 n=1 Tax=Crassostrea virginica TaxID=6565 RepID=A0A8B8CV12_CRAVI|nr:uncharacterized protein LOC111122182 [Crassostrea virginica]